MKRDNDRPVFHQIINTDPSRGYDGRPVQDATTLPEGHLPGKFTNSRRRRNGSWSVEGRGIAARAPRPGMMVDANPLW